MAYQAVVQKQFLEDLTFGVDTERKTALKILKLVEVVLRDPSSGEGKPETIQALVSGHDALQVSTAWFIW
jgi:toxin YoeB